MTPGSGLAKANVLQDKPSGIRETCQNFLQTFATVQAMIIGAAIFSSVPRLRGGGPPFRRLTSTETVRSDLTHMSLYTPKTSLIYCRSSQNLATFDGPVHSIYAQN